jgi:hypothetical protein
MTIYDTREGARLMLNHQNKGHWNRWGLVDTGVFDGGRYFDVAVRVHVLLSATEGGSAGEVERGANNDESAGD